MDTKTEMVDAYLLDYVVTWSETQRDGVDRWAWDLSEMVDAPLRLDVDGAKQARTCSFEFSTQAKCQNYAIKWLRDNRPELVRAATWTVGEGIRQRAMSTNS